MSVAQRMTMITTVQRNNAEIDEYNHPGPPKWETIGIDVMCYVWEKTASKMLDNGKLVVVSEPTAIIPIGIDITEKDRLYNITDRRGNELFGTMYINAVIRRKDHLELRLRHVK